MTAGRPPSHPSGKKLKITPTISPAIHDWLTDMAKSNGSSVAKELERQLWVAKSKGPGPKKETLSMRITVDMRKAIEAETGRRSAARMRALSLSECCEQLMREALINLGRPVP